MRAVWITALGTAVLVASSSAYSETYSIPPDQLDTQRLYFGRSGKFERPAEVKYNDVLQTTAEYKEIKRKKIERGTSKYWILLSQASDRVSRAIAHVSEKKNFDLVADQGYLGGLKPPIAAEDITEPVLAELAGRSVKVRETKAAKEPAKKSGETAEDAEKPQDKKDIEPEKK